MKKLLFLIISLTISLTIKADNLVLQKNSRELSACIKGNLSNANSDLLNKINDYIEIYNFCRNSKEFDNLEEYLLYIGNIKNPGNYKK